YSGADYPPRGTSPRRQSKNPSIHRPVFHLVYPCGFHPGPAHRAGHPGRRTGTDAVSNWLPGALVISIPVAIVAGIGRAARNGMLIKGGEYLETAAKISAVAVDKTGTLTEGRPQLTDVIVLDPMADRTDVLRWAAAAEAGSEHPLASPIIAAAQEHQVAPEDLP